MRRALELHWPALLVISSCVGIGLSVWVGMSLAVAAILVLATLGLALSVNGPARLGALAVALGLEILHAVIAYVITPWALAKQGTYGALGVAAALLVGLFLISRLVVASAVVNATLWERRTRPAA